MTLTSELWVDGFGHHVEVHERNDGCVEHGCCIHNPSDHHMREWPMLWRDDRYLMERICPHGVGHPDPDQMRFEIRRSRELGLKVDIYRGVHGCDGCCSVHNTGTEPE